MTLLTKVKDDPKHVKAPGKLIIWRPWQNIILALLKADITSVLWPRAGLAKGLADESQNL
jgi:hypothetical protein